MALYIDTVPRISLGQIRGSLKRRAYRKVTSFPVDHNGVRCVLKLETSSGTGCVQTRRWIICPSCGRRVNVVGAVDVGTANARWACKSCAGWRARNPSKAIQGALRLTEKLQTLWRHTQSNTVNEEPRNDAVVAGPVAVTIDCRSCSSTMAATSLSSLPATPKIEEQIVLMFGCSACGGHKRVRFLREREAWFDPARPFNVVKVVRRNGGFIFTRSKGAAGLLHFAGYVRGEDAITICCATIGGHHQAQILFARDPSFHVAPHL